MRHRFYSAIFFCLFTILGCGPSSKKNVPAPTVTVWHWMTDRDAAFRELAKRYEAETAVKVDFELYAPSDAYAQKVRAAAQGVNLPDVFGILGEKIDFASFIKAGHVLGLTPYMEESSGAWKNSFFNTALAADEFSKGNIYGVSPGIYAVPIDIMIIEMLYNKDLLQELGLNPDCPPVTFQDFINTGKMIKERDLQGLVSGWGEPWMINCFVYTYAFNIMGKDKVMATIKGEVPYTDPEWIEVFGLFKQMRDSGMAANDVVSMVNKTAEQLFANGKAVFAFNGSWCVNVYKGMNPDLNYAAMLPPRASGNYPMAIWGSAGSSFMVNARSKVKDEAVKFLKWLTERRQQAYLVETTLNLPANKECAGKLPAALAQFADDLELSVHPAAWDVYEYPLVMETLARCLQSVIIGEKTPEQAAIETQGVKERESAKRHI